MSAGAPSHTHGHALPRFLEFAGIRMSTVSSASEVPTATLRFVRIVGKTSKLQDRCDRWATSRVRLNVMELEESGLIAADELTPNP
jgi:hypothetical protein